MTEEEKRKAENWVKATEEQKKVIATHVQTSNASGKIKYSTDEITILIALYGKDSEIYKAMMNGEKISLLIRKSIAKKIEKGQKKDELEYMLLTKCIKKEESITV